MRIVRVYTGDDDQSHLEHLEIPELPHPRNQAATLTDLVPATTVGFRQAESGPIDFHRAPRRQFVVCLSGQLEVECGDGSKHVFSPGDVLFADDRTGQGHRSRDIGGPRRSMWVGVPDDLDISGWRRVESPD